MKTFGALLVGLLLLMVDGYDLQSIAIVAPEIARAASLKLADFAPVFAAGLAGTIPGAMVAGSVARVVGHRMALAVALTVFGLGTLASAYAPTLPALAVVRFIVGLGLGASVPLVLTLVAEQVSGRTRATFVTITLCGQPLGAVIGAALCARLIPEFGWRSAFLLGGTLPLVLLPAILVFREPASAAGQARSAGDARVSALFHRDLFATTVLICCSTFLAAFVVYVVVNWLPGLMRAAGHSLDVSMLALSLFNFGGIAGAVLLGLLSDRYGSLKVVPVAFLLAAVTLCALSFSQHALSFLQAAVLFVGIAGYGAAISLGPLAVLQYSSELRTMGTGWALGFGRLGGTISPLVAGAMLSSGVAAEGLFGLAAGVALLCAICLIALGHRSSASSTLRHREQGI